MFIKSTMLSAQLTTLVVILNFQGIRGTVYPPIIKFTPELYIAVGEDANNNTLLVCVEATSRNHDNVTIEIGDEGTNQLVRINQMSTVHYQQRAHAYLDTKLDADRGLTEYRLYFKAKDSQAEGVEYISMIVTDVNDEHPVFENEPYQEQINESLPVGTELDFKIKATDLDKGLGGQVTYSMTPTGQAASSYSGVFVIDPITGLIKLKKELDYEDINFYQYNVTAKDGGGLSSSTNLLIRITDVQDTPPFFQGLPYVRTIQEDVKVGSFVMKVTALDGDRGVPNEVEYSLIPDDECYTLFSISNLTGVVHVSSSLDTDNGTLKEKGGYCEIKVKATELQTDIPQPGNFTSETTMTIIVKDINDNGPKFLEDEYHASVKENLTGIPITIHNHNGIYVEDIDFSSENGVFEVVVMYNGSVYYNLVPTPRTVHSRGTVLLRLNESFLEGFDFEKQTRYEFQIVATESKGGKQDNCTVFLDIEDVNDNDPEFNKTEFNVNVSENRPDGYQITTITATDLDGGDFGKIEYSLKGTEGKFGVYSDNGTIYAIYDSSVHDDFPLDRERKTEYYLTLQAEDGGRRRTAVSVIVRLEDVNDNPPIFLQPNGYTVALKEGETQFSSGTFYVSASDMDQEGTNNSEIRFKLFQESDFFDNFTINETTGIISVKHSIDYESIDQSHTGTITLVVVAHDLGHPRLSTNTTVSVQVQDVNDKVPTFNMTKYEASIQENATAGQSVITVSAFDDDGKPPNNEFTFFIEKGSSDRFRVNGSSGLIFVEVGARFDRETQDQYNLTVIAIDRGDPQLTGTTLVIVTLTDVNDEPPIFLGSPYEATVFENASVNMTVVNCNASDSDLDSHLVYYVTDLVAFDFERREVNSTLIQHYFSIDTDTGVIRVKSAPDAEIVTQIILYLLVVDINGPQNATGSKFSEHVFVKHNASGRQPGRKIAMKFYYLTFDPDHIQSVGISWEGFIRGQVTINILDINDEEPVFKGLPYLANLYENAVVGTIITTVTALDADINTENKRVTYAMGDNPESAFGVDKEKGTVVLSSSGKIDRKTNQFVTLSVRAVDGVHISEADVKVTLIDETQLGIMIVNGKPDEIQLLKDEIFERISALTGNTFHYISVDADVNPQRSRVLFYVTDQGNSTILEGEEIDKLVDLYGSKILTISDKIVQIQAYKRPEEENVFQLKTTYVMAAAIVLLVIVLAVIIYFYVNTSSKYKRRLKAATVSSKDKKDGPPTDLPGSNVYSSKANPLLDKDDEIKQTIDNISFTESDVLDDNEVDFDQKQPLDDYGGHEEKEVRMDIYEEELRGGTDALTLALQGFELKNNDKNKLINEDENLSNGFINAAYGLPNQYESTDI